MSSHSRKLLVVLGNQLFPMEHVYAVQPDVVFMAEDMGLCTYVRHHQQKIVLFLAAMRNYRDSLKAAGFNVHYVELEPQADLTYEDRLARAFDAHDIDEIVHFEIEDKAMESRLVAFVEARELPREELASPMFLVSRSDFTEFARGKKQLRMAEFYKRVRRKEALLLEADGEPEGGQWSFDEDNRKKLPKSVTPPTIPPVSRGEHVDDLIELVIGTFSDHPGDAGEFWWPTTRADATEWLDCFIAERLECFGPYEDAMTTRSATVFHSAISPALNLGLITPREVIDRVIAAYQERGLPLQSIEGFVRQVIGWREFVRGVYREHSESMDTTNFFDHQRELTPSWYDGSTGIAPLDDTIKTALRLGWTHHIPRLMVAGNLMTLCEIHPNHAHRWFMEMYVDSSEWVMGPNVYGMGLFSDGGVFATKPYICGSNYMKKMSDYGSGEWCDVVDGLYWRFIDRHRDFFAKNPRLALMPRALDRQSAARLEKIFAAADAFLEQHTLSM
jgi:deoxyribodipyrimidine photolyase-related protein